MATRHARNCRTVADPNTTSARRCLGRCGAMIPTRNKFCCVPCAEAYDLGRDR